MKTVAYLTLYSVGLVLALIAGFQGMIDLVGREHVIVNLLLSPFVACSVYLMYGLIFDFVERHQVREVIEPVQALKESSSLRRHDLEQTSELTVP